MTLLGNKWPSIRGFANERAGRANTVMQVIIFLQLGAQRMQATRWGFLACLGEAFVFAQVLMGSGAPGLPTKRAVPDATAGKEGPR